MIYLWVFLGQSNVMIEQTHRIKNESTILVFKRME